jgi:vacuolar-type H+-ATPase subunit H
MEKEMLRDGVMKMVRPISDVELSPLDQIRQTEAEVTRAVAAARQAAEQLVAKAHLQAEEIKEQARVAGVLDGEARFKQMTSSAEEEARIIIAHAQQRAKELRRKGEQYMDRGVHHAVDMVIGLGGEVGAR